MQDKILELGLESLKVGLLSSERYYQKPIVIFNSASFCGYTKQLSDFQSMWEQKTIVPIALPTNEFNNQEPGDDYELLQFYKKNYNITFPVCKKTDLTHKVFGLFGSPDWNFNKYLFDKDHNFVKKFDGKFQPADLLNHV